MFPAQPYQAAAWLVYVIKIANLECSWAFHGDTSDQFIHWQSKFHDAYAYIFLKFFGQSSVFLPGLNMIAYLS